MRVAIGWAVACVGAAVSAQWANAGTIVQTVGFQLQYNGSTIPGIQQLPPSLGPLNAVRFDSVAGGSESFITLINTTSNPVSFNVTAVNILSTDAGRATITDVIPVTLPANGMTSQFSYNYNGGQSISMSRVLTTDLARFVGTGMLAVLNAVDSFPPEVPFSLRTDNPAVTISSGQPSGIGYVYRGTETVTYYYGDTLPPTPEPTSVVLMGFGLAAVAAATRRRGAG